MLLFDLANYCVFHEFFSTEQIVSTQNLGNFFFYLKTTFYQKVMGRDKLFQITKLLVKYFKSHIWWLYLVSFLNFTILWVKQKKNKNIRADDFHVFKCHKATHRRRYDRIYNSEHFISKSFLEVDLHIISVLNWNKVRPET